MFKEIVSFEEKLIARIDFQNFIKRLNPEIQQIFYNAYGKQLEKMPTIYLLNDKFLIKDFLKIINQVCPVRQQKILFMRYGITTGRQMSIQEVADKVGISPTTVQMIESKVIRMLRRGHSRQSQRLLEYLES